MIHESHRAKSARRLSCAMLGMATLAALASPTQAATEGAGASILPRNLSYWEMFVHASPIVQVVMVMLMLASVATWTIWLAKLFELRSAKQRLAADIQILADATDIEAVAPLSHRASATMLQVVMAEIARAGNIRTGAAAEGLKDRVAARVVSVEKDAVENVIRGTAVLATVGAIAPFIGLFGTVWGIMTSFIGISESQTTSLAVVAPGIAEALLATAIGLFAAIPAVIMYNHVVRNIAGFRNQLSNASTQVACLLSHSLDARVEQTRETILHAAE